jgi:HAD superfamily hydrolase (TIGR01509 family)
MIIFDFDLTLVDTSPVEHLRQQRRWNQVIAAAPKLKVYDGVHELIDALHAAGRPMAILTKSPNMVPDHFVKLHGWPIPTVLGYHQVTHRKPHPEGLFKAMSLAGVEPKDVVHVGDRAEDTAASKAAGVIAIGAAWGLADASELEASNPDHLFHRVADLRSFLKANG